MPHREAKTYRKSLMDAIDDDNLDATRVALEKLYGAESHERLFDVDMQWTPRSFAPIVDAAILASVNDFEGLRDEMTQNIQCLHEKFGVESSTVEAVKHVIESIDPEDSKDVAISLIQEQLGTTELAGYLKVNDYI